jgi:hypothetical protein
MNPLECAQIEELLDLCAAGECDDAGKEAVARHVAGCPRCEAELSRARAVAGLLDLHFRRDDGLARLERRLRQQVRLPAAAWRRVSGLRPLLSLAAMLLLSLGLGLGLTPFRTNAPHPGPTLLALEASKEHALALPAAVRGHEMAVPIAKKPSALDLDLEGKSPAQWERALRDGVKADRLPLPPRVPLRLVVRNFGRGPLHVEVGGKGFACRLDLSGPRYLRLLAGADARSLVPRMGLTIIPPGREVAIPWGRLIAVEDGRVEYLYPLAPGEYRLTVALRVLAWRDGERPRAVWLPPSAPITLRVGRGR